VVVAEPEREVFVGDGERVETVLFRYRVAEDRPRRRRRDT
jgi:hypothetical protein